MRHFATKQAATERKYALARLADGQLHVVVRKHRAGRARHTRALFGVRHSAVRAQRAHGAELGANRAE